MERKYGLSGPDQMSSSRDRLQGIPPGEKNLKWTGTFTIRCRVPIQSAPFAGGGGGGRSISICIQGYLHLNPPVSRKRGHVSTLGLVHAKFEVRDDRKSNMCSQICSLLWVSSWFSQLSCCHKVNIKIIIVCWDIHHEGSQCTSPFWIPGDN